MTMKLKGTRQWT